MKTTLILALAATARTARLKMVANILRKQVMENFRAELHDLYQRSAYGRGGE